MVPVGKVWQSRTPPPSFSCPPARPIRLLPAMALKYSSCNPRHCPLIPAVGPGFPHEVQPQGKPSLNHGHGPYAHPLLQEMTASRPFPDGDDGRDQQIQSSQSIQSSQANNPKASRRIGARKQSIPSPSQCSTEALTPTTQGIKCSLAAAKNRLRGGQKLLQAGGRSPEPPRG